MSFFLRFWTLFRSEGPVSTVFSPYVISNRTYERIIKKCDTLPAKGKMGDVRSRQPWLHFRGKLLSSTLYNNCVHIMYKEQNCAFHSHSFEPKVLGFCTKGVSGGFNALVLTKTKKFCCLCQLIFSFSS